MGLDAQVIGIGRFSKRLLPVLEYPENFYVNTAEGDEIVVNVFIAPTSDSSYGLARAFGVDAFDFGRHHLRSEAADFSLLAELFGDEGVSRFTSLRDAGFDFYYLPNG
jgi:hypothetical protein